MDQGLDLRNYHSNQREPPNSEVTLRLYAQASHLLADSRSSNAAADACLVMGLRPPTPPFRPKAMRKSDQYFSQACTAALSLRYSLPALSHYFLQASLPLVSIRNASRPLSACHRLREF